MCFSAMSEQDMDRLAKSFEAQVDWNMYENLARARLEYVGAEQGRAKLPKGMEDALMRRGGAAAEAIAAWRQRQERALTEDLFKQRKRVADAQRSLEVKETKKAREDIRIGTDKVDQAKRRLDDLKRTTHATRDDRFFPLWYSSVIVADEGRRWVRPLRYLCRPYWMPASSDFTKDRKVSGKYNARRDNIESFWRPLFGQRHALIVATQFYEQVQQPDGSFKEVEFFPRTGDAMLIACLWSDWSDPKGELPDLHSFSAITDDPEPEVADAGHERTVINIKPEHVDAWLNPGGNLAAMQAIFDDKRHPYYEHREAA